MRGTVVVVTRGYTREKMRYCVTWDLSLQCRDFPCAGGAPVVVATGLLALFYVGS